MTKSVHLVTGDSGIGFAWRSIGKAGKWDSVNDANLREAICAIIELARLGM